MIALRYAAPIALLVILLFIGLCCCLRRRAAKRHPLAQRPMLCPGPELSDRLLARVHPRRWLNLVRRPGCFYDLSGLVPDATGRVCCPECNRRITSPAQCYRPAGQRMHRWRRDVIAGSVLAMLIVLWLSPFVRHGQWAALLPTDVLLAIYQQAGPSAPRVLKREINNRAFEPTFTREHRQALAEILLRELGEDDIPHNAIDAVDVLFGLGHAAAPALERGLRSPDWQCRQLCAHVLRSMQGYVPGDDLIAVSVEGLRSRSTGQVNSTSQPNLSAWVNPALEALRYLPLYPELLDASLAPAIAADDPQQRLMAAAIAGLAGRESLIDQAAPVLIEHLAENDIAEDAKLATLALMGFRSPKLAAYIEPLIDDPTDAQRRTLARQIITAAAIPERFHTIIDNAPSPVTNAIWGPATQLTPDMLRPARIRARPAVAPVVVAVTGTP